MIKSRGKEEPEKTGGETCGKTKQILQFRGFVQISNG